VLRGTDLVTSKACFFPCDKQCCTQVFQDDEIKHILLIMKSHCAHFSDASTVRPDNLLFTIMVLVSLTRWPPFTPLPPRKIPETHFCQGLSRVQGHNVAGRFRSIEKSNDLIRIRSGDIPVCIIVPQPTTLPRAPSDRATGPVTKISFWRTE
jgi:hypothetical protein